MSHFWIFFSLVLAIPVFGQQHNQFTFPELDGHVVSVWSAAYRGNTSVLEQSLAATNEAWDLVSEQIITLHISHFAGASFVNEQSALLQELQRAVEIDDYDDLAFLAYEFLTGFREVRSYFTSDLYPLDELLAAFDLYQELHYAVDDPLLGLYDWKEFVRLFTTFKEQFEHYHRLARPGFHGEDEVLFKLMSQRVRDCSAEFEQSLKTAMQNEFVSPCDDTHDALIDLIELYAKPLLALQ